MADVSDRELYARMLDALSVMHTCARGLAHNRNEERWLLVARQMDLLKAATTKLMHAPTAGQPRFIIPPHASS